MWDTPYRRERAKKIADEIAESVPGLRRGNLLEFGCGTGLISFYLWNETAHFTLLDLSEGMIEVVNQKIKTHNFANMTAIVGDIFSAQIQERHYHVIYSSMALHHVLDIAQAAGRFSDIIVENGFLCIVDLTEDDGAFHRNESGFNGHNGFDAEQLAILFARFGFAKISSRVFFHDKKQMPHGTVAYSLFCLLMQKKGEESLMT